MRSDRILLATLLSLMGVAQAAPLPTPLPTVEQIGTEIGISADEVEKVKQGKMVTLYPGDTSERDLAVAFVFLVKAPPAELVRAFRASGDLAQDPSVVASHRLLALGDLDGLKLTPAGAAEARRFLEAEPGDTLNLSTSEIASCRALGATATQAMVEAELRRLLFARFVAYRDKGLPGIAPYARAKGQERQPGQELRHLVDEAKLLDKYAPAFKALLLGYPRGKPAQLEEAFSWIQYAQDDRPTVTLRHRMSAQMGGGFLVADREYYVSQGHNDMQAVAAVLPVGDGSVVFYRAHTSTDRVAGGAGAAKHGIGRRIMAKQLEKIFEKSRGRFAR